MQLGAAFCDGGIDAENTSIERPHDLTLQPRPQHRPLRRAPPFDLENAEFQFEHADGGEVERCGRDAVRPSANIRIGPTGTGFPQFRYDIRVE
jgi:hypothetical protein